MSVRYEVVGRKDGRIENVFRDGRTFARYSSAVKARYRAQLMIESDLEIREINEVTDTERLGRMTEEFFLKIIRDWKYSWMNQTQNDQKDYENYHRRAFGIDANMVHSLADRIVTAIKDIK